MATAAAVAAGTVAAASTTTLACSAEGACMSGVQRHKLIAQSVPAHTSASAHAAAGGPTPHRDASEPTAKRPAVAAAVVVAAASANARKFDPFGLPIELWLQILMSDGMTGDTLARLECTCSYFSACEAPASDPFGEFSAATQWLNGSLPERAARRITASRRTICGTLLDGHDSAFVPQDYGRRGPSRPLRTNFRPLRYT